MSHTKDFVHAWGDSVNRGSATDFVIEFWGKFLATLNDSFTLLAVRIPSIFSFSASFLAESREGNLAEAVLDNLITFGKLVFFPITELFGSRFDGFGNFSDLLVGEWVVINLLPILLASIVAIILGALCYKEMKMSKLLWSGIFHFVYDLD